MTFLAGAIIGAVTVWRVHRWWTRRDVEALDDDPFRAAITRGEWGRP